MINFQLLNNKRYLLTLFLVIILAFVFPGYSNVSATGSDSSSYSFYLFDSTLEYGPHSIQCNANSLSQTSGEWTITYNSTGYCVPNGITYPFQLLHSDTATMCYRYPSEITTTLTLPNYPYIMSLPNSFNGAWLNYPNIELESWQYPILAYSNSRLLVNYPWYFSPLGVYKEIRVPSGGSYNVNE
jgi:hypothetical protein